MQHTGPVEIDGKATFPRIENGDNVALSFSAEMLCPDGVKLTVTDMTRGRYTAADIT